MPAASDNDRPEPEAGATQDRTGRDQAARLLVTEMVDKLTDETTTWITKSAAAFKECFDKAAPPNRYSADEMVKDMAAMWTLNLDYLGRLARIGLRDDARPGQAPTGARPPTGEAPPTGESPGP